MEYLDKNLVVLKENLNKENFDRIRSVIWESSVSCLHVDQMIPLLRCLVAVVKDTCEAFHRMVVNDNVYDNFRPKSWTRRYS